MRLQALLDWCLANVASQATTSLVKELRLQGISTWEAANAYAPSFIDDYNKRVSKTPQSDFNAHRMVRADEDLHLTMTHLASRCVSNHLTVQYDKGMYMLEDLPETRALIHHYIDVYEYPDGEIEVRANGTALSPSPLGAMTD